MAHVVVIDDNALLRDVICEMVQEDGHTATALRDGSQALPALRASAGPAVVLLDRFMPHLDVEVLLTEIARDPTLATRHAYVLMTASQHDWPATFAQLLTQLAVPMLDKPFELDALLTLVAQRAETIVPPRSPYPGC